MWRIENNRNHAHAIHPLFLRQSLTFLVSLHIVLAYWTCYVSFTSLFIHHAYLALLMLF